MKHGPFLTTTKPSLDEDQNRNTTGNKKQQRNYYQDVQGLKSPSSHNKGPKNPMKYLSGDKFEAANEYKKLR